MHQDDRDALTTPPCHDYGRSLRPLKQKMVRRAKRLQRRKSNEDGENRNNEGGEMLSGEAWPGDSSTPPPKEDCGTGVTQPALQWDALPWDPAPNPVNDSKYRCATDGYEVDTG
mmetsp:Transcript_11989/g.18317  ORF Transcript_11989/g.18317 Transcript_11989/m.18317 type:complete len:114 (+) Transcript_11989:211-552(+)